MTDDRPSDERLNELWDLVAKQLADQHPGMPPAVTSQLRGRFIAGAIEHGDDWLSWTDDRFQHEIDEELLDLTLYRAMRPAARAHQRDNHHEGTTP